MCVFAGGVYGCVAGSVPSSVLLYVHRNPKDYEGRGTPDGHLDLHTAPELSGKGLCFVSFKDPYPQMNLQLTVPDR